MPLSTGWPRILSSADGNVRSAAAFDRSLSCRITDLDVTFLGRLSDGAIQDVASVPGPPPHKAEIRLPWPVTTWSPWSTAS